MGKAAHKDLTLSQHEWQAVSVALSDAARCGCAETDTVGPLRRLYRTLIGHVARRPLDDARLRAVRSFVCETNRRHPSAARYVPALLDNGFNARQVDALALLSA